jgi:hypothetical protein
MDEEMGSEIIHLFLPKIWPKGKELNVHILALVITPTFHLNARVKAAVRVLWNLRQKRMGPLFGWFVMWVQGLVFTHSKRRGFDVEYCPCQQIYQDCIKSKSLVD